MLTQVKSITLVKNLLKSSEKNHNVLNFSFFEYLWHSFVNIIKKKSIKTK